MSDTVISVDSLSKAYRIGLRDDIPDTLMGALTGWFKAPLRNWRRLRSLDVSAAVAELEHRTSNVPQQPSNQGNGDVSARHGQRTKDKGPRTKNDDIIWALRDVSFGVKEGEVVGIIGRNGAGKSTLLKILTRITEPTSGRAVIRGRVSSLLEVGTGFHPELTGRENVYMNGTILGMTKREIDRKFDEIVDFSGVEQFLDTPVKRYSSGMQVRLAFAVAAHLEPEILVIDEVLAVGDGAFQRKCIGKMQDVAACGRTVLFVSHNMAAVQGLCQRALVLQTGGIVCDDTAAAAIQHYFRLIQSGHERNGHRFLHQGSRKYTADFQVAEVWITSQGQACPVGLPTGAPLELHLRCRVARPFARLVLALRIHKLGTGNVTKLHSERSGAKLPEVVENDFTVTCSLRDLLLGPGEYTVVVGVKSAQMVIDFLDDAAHFTVLPTDFFGTGSGQEPGDGCVVCRPSWEFRTVE